MNAHAALSVEKEIVCDDRVSAISEYNPNNGMITVMLSNYGDNVWSGMRRIREEMYQVFMR